MALLIKMVWNLFDAEQMCAANNNKALATPTCWVFTTCRSLSLHGVSSPPSVFTTILYNAFTYYPNVAVTFIFIYFLFFIFIYFILFFFYGCVRVFASVRGLSLAAASGGHSSSQCAGLSLSRPLLLRSTGSRRAGSAIVAHGPSRYAARGIFPDQDSNPCPLHWQADSQPLRHQGSPCSDF